MEELDDYDYVNKNGIYAEDEEEDDWDDDEEDFDDDDWDDFFDFD